MCYCRTKLVQLLHSLVSDVKFNADEVNNCSKTKCFTAVTQIDPKQNVLKHVHKKYLSIEFSMAVGQHLNQVMLLLCSKAELAMLYSSGMTLFQMLC